MAEAVVTVFSYGLHCIFHTAMIVAVKRIILNKRCLDLLQTVKCYRMSEFTDSAPTPDELITDMIERLMNICIEA